MNRLSFKSKNYLEPGSELAIWEVGSTICNSSQTIPNGHFERWLVGRKGVESMGKREKFNESMKKVIYFLSKTLSSYLSFKPFNPMNAFCGSFPLLSRCHSSSQSLPLLLWQLPDFSMEIPIKTPHLPTPFANILWRGLMIVNMDSPIRFQFFCSDSCPEVSLKFSIFFKTFLVWFLEMCLMWVFRFSWKCVEKIDGGSRTEEEEKVYSWLYALAKSDKDLVFEYVRSTERGQCIISFSRDSITLGM